MRDLRSLAGREGGPHALACAAMLGARVTKVAVLASPAPKDPDALDWHANMAGSNVDAFEADAAIAEADILARAAGAKEDSEYILRMLAPDLYVGDNRVVGDVGIRKLIIASFKEALKNGPYGWLDDVMAFRRPWGFDLSEVERPVAMWHGREDRFTPVRHAFYNAARIGNGTILVTQPEMGHFNATEVLPSMLADLIRP